MLDTIVQLPNNLFYNTGITTYIGFLSNNKEAKRKGKALLIDASRRFTKLRKNPGAKNCELTADHIVEIQATYL
jgi:type I restriction enzyme M protein